MKCRKNDCFTCPYPDCIDDSISHQSPLSDASKARLSQKGKARRAAFETAGLCTSCGKRVPEIGYKRCYICRSYDKRTKEKIGLSKKIADKNAQRALEYGVTRSEAKGGLCRYLDKLYLSNGNANNVRVYRRYVYLFRGNTLLTIIPLPNKFYALADKLQKQKGETAEVDNSGV